MCSFFIQCVVVFFFKQKTAYEMRISDWSSDVCSSDLARRHDPHALQVRRTVGDVGPDQERLAVACHQLREAGAATAALQCRDLRARQFARQVRRVASQPQRLAAGVLRWEERRGGKEGCSTCRSRWYADQ